jgi:AcrR family transcriptional regulator
MNEHDVRSTKERLFYAALTLFAQKGFQTATVREICRNAGVSNINSINYYYGSKERLYNAILEMMFAAHGNQMENYPSSSDPVEQLRTFIVSYCKMLYGGGEVARNVIRIFTAEMARPSKVLRKLVEKHTKPQTLAFLETVRSLLGSDAPEDAARDTCVSIGSQIIYYSYAWPVFSKVFPEHPGMAAYYDKLAEHIIRFSLGGIKSVQAHYQKHSTIRKPHNKS